MIPTAILGVALGYLLVETDNLFYSMLFHFVNNAVPVLLLGLLSLMPVQESTGDIEAVQTAMSSHLPLFTVAVYMLYACGAPFLIYIGRYLIHRGQPGYDRGLFPREKRKTLLALLGISAYILVIGVVMFIGGCWSVIKYAMPLY